MRATVELRVDKPPAPEARQPSPIRIAAAGDVHVRASHPEEAERAFAELGDVDLVLLAGDLTTHGEPAEAEVLARACEPLAGRVVAVLGNHDWHLGRQEEIARILTAGGIAVLERSSTVRDLAGQEVGVVGAKGFVGGFGDSHLPDFGEPLLRRLYAETSADVEALDRGLHEIATCSFRIVLLHYSPVAETLDGEPHGIWAFLGNDRLAAPILQHQPDLVVHGHAHIGSFEAAIGPAPVYNVSVPVIGRDFWVFELTDASRPSGPVH